MNNAAPQPLDPAIARLQSGLMGVLALIFVYIGIADDTRDAKEMLDGKREETAVTRAFRLFCGEPYDVLRRNHRRIRKILLPAESAVRRLIIALAADLPAARLPPSEVKRLSIPPKPPAARIKQPHNPPVMVPRHMVQPERPLPGRPTRMPRFCLFDQMKRFFRKRYPKRRSEPRIISLYADRLPPSTLKPPQTDFDMVSSDRLMRRVTALTAALNDLPAQAQRLAVWKARRDLRLAATHPSKGWIEARHRAFNGTAQHYHFSIRREPLRPGRPPGSPAMRLSSDKHRDEHTLLKECSEMAWWAVQRHYYERRDSS